MSNEYDDQQGYVGPGIFHVPRSLISREENYEGYKHDYSNSYQNLGFHAYTNYNQGDADWQVKGPYTALAKLVWEYKKLMLPHSGEKLSGTRNVRPIKKMSRNVEDEWYDFLVDNEPHLIGSKRRGGDQPLSVKRRGGSNAENAAHLAYLTRLARRRKRKGHKVNVRRMARGKRKYGTGKKKGRLSRRLGKKGLRRKRVGRRRVYGRGGSKRLWRAIKKVASKLKRVNALTPRNVSIEFSAGHVGIENKWTYINVDNLFAQYETVGSPATAEYPLTGTASVGWNQFTPMQTACAQIYGNYPYTNDQYVFNYRSMKTLIQAPTNTPTFVEVYLLKPLRAEKSGEGNISNPIVHFDIGASSSSDMNPGYTAAYGLNAPGGIFSYYKTFGNSLISYNPLEDKQLLKQRFKVTKKWKFTLGPMGSKLITIKSKKRYMFRPAEFSYSSQTEVDRGSPSGKQCLSGYIDPADLGADIQACVDYSPSSRIMIMRWHGWNTISSAASSNNGILKTGISGDPICVRRWFDFGLYKMDASYDIDAFTRYNTYEETTKTNLVSFQLSNPQQTPYQPS